jgi:methionine-gamma-lyase
MLINFKAHRYIMLKNDEGNMKTATRIIHGSKNKNQYSPLSQPIYQTSTFAFDTVEEFKKTNYDCHHNNRGTIYTRFSNPTNYVLEKQIALLEGAEASVTLGSGMGAISATLFTFLRKGDHIVFDNQIYEGTQYLANNILPNFGIEVTIVDFHDVSKIKKAIRKNTKIVYFETPTNPKLKINDIQAIAKLTHSVNKNIRVIMDGTLASPFIQKPISLGADIVIHSLTKYINGHGDIVGGAICGKQKDINLIRFCGVKYLTGSILSPQNAYLVLRGSKTLNLRMPRHCSTALEVANYLNNNKHFKKVYYPGLPNHPKHEVASKQMNGGYGAIVSCETNLTFKQTVKFVDSLKYFGKGISLGDPESLISFPTAMSIDPKVKLDTFLRLSIGLEDPIDLIDDIKQALDKALKVKQ